MGVPVKKHILCIILIILPVSILGLSFTENFDNDNYKDTTNTTTNWPAVYDSKNVTILDREDKFAETSGVTVWGADDRRCHGRWNQTRVNCVSGVPPRPAAVRRPRCARKSR